MYDYYLFPLPRASKWNRSIFDHSEVKIDLYSKDYVQVAQSQMLGFIISVNRYLPSHVKNGIAILLCIF